MAGWIRLHRQLLGWEWYDDINTTRLFIHLLLTVNYEPRKWHGIDVKSGQIVTSRQKLAQQTGLSEQQVRTAENKLKSTNQITNQTTKDYSLITILNWDNFQQDNRQDNKPTTNQQQTNNKPITTTKEVKKERSKESPPTPTGVLEKAEKDFNVFWEFYPEKVQKKKAIMAFRDVVERGVDFEKVMEGVELYVKNKPKETKWQYAHNWLKDERFEDDYSRKIKR